MFNLAGNPEYATIKSQLQNQLNRELTEQGDPRTLGNGDVFDHYKYEGKPFDYTENTTTGK